MEAPALHALASAAFVALTLAAAPARAGMFDDDEARRAILDLRQKVQIGEDQRRTMADQIDQLRRSLLDLNNQLESVRSDNAKLRGQNEQLARDVAELQVKQKDVAQSVDDRMRKFEPQKVSVDGKEFMADPEEKRAYDDALDVLRKGDFNGSVASLNAFRKRYPTSGYNDSVSFWLGNALYGARQYPAAVASFRSLVSNAPDSPKAPEALLAIANCQAELKDRAAARRTLDELLKQYPQSEAAQAGKDRLATLK
jgi:tol-pal system protein YbgF